MEETLQRTSVASNPLKRIVIGLVDLGFTAIGYLVLSIPALLVLFQAITIEGVSTTISVYVIACLTGALCVLFDIFFRVFIPLKFGGRTLGSAFFGAKIVSFDGEEPSLPSLLIRAVVLVFLVLFSVGFYYVAEALCLLFSKGHYDFTDMISGTYVADMDKKEIEA